MIPKHRDIMNRASKRFIAGESIDEAMTRVKTLTSEGFSCLVNFIGDHGDTPEVRDGSIAAYSAIADLLQKEGVKAEVSPKLSPFGLFGRDLHPGKTKGLFLALMQKFHAQKIPVWIDEEELCYEEKTNAVLKELNSFMRVGKVLQAYNRNAEAVIDDLSGIEPKIPVRLCKGAYSEPRIVAFKRMKEIRFSYKMLFLTLIRKGHYVQVATHDRMITDWVRFLVEIGALTKEQFEFAHLDGIDMKLARELRALGFRVAIYVTYGTDREGFVIRRIVEKPRYALLPLKAMLRA